MAKDKVTITFEEAIEYIEEEKRAAVIMTDEMRKLLIIARGGKSTVSYDKLAKIWKKLGWPGANFSTIRRMWLSIEAEVK